MDVAQFLDFMLGSAQAVSKGTPAQTRDTLLKKAQLDLRSVIEDTLPIVYLVKSKDIANNMLQALGKMNEAELSKYISHILDPVEGPIGPTELGFDEAFDEIYTELVADLPAVSKNITAGLDKRITKSLSIPGLAKEVARINSILTTASSAYAVSLSIGTSQDTTKITSVLRSEITKAGSELRSYLAKNTPAVFADASEVLTSYDTVNERLVVGSTFSGLTKVINETASPIIREWLKKHKVIPTNNLAVGTFTAAGHVAVATEDAGGVRQVVGINTPLTQSTLVYASQQAERNLTMDTFVLDSTHIDCALVVNKNVSSFKSLLSLNFSFVMSQESEFNSVTLRTAEVRAMDKIVASVFSNTREQLKASFLKRIVSKQGLSYLVSALRFSPTVLESIALQVLSGLKGSTNTKINATSNAKNTGKFSPTSLLKQDIQKTVKKIANTVSKTTVPVRSPIKVKTFSLVNLQQIINDNLRNVLSANMGNGGQKNILNYRTGRFASSVQVERMSQSRAGMITAFYSYMKNPYQTFEPGFAQGFPETRDPKLLIAKSIREIAATKVGNRLRAVSI